MQIEEIVIYNKDDDKRTLPIRTGEVNIITGKSRTGKSAIIDIVEYCFGRSSCKIAQGVIRETASWYGLLLEHKGEKIFVARKNPPGKQKSTDHAYVQRGLTTSPRDPPLGPNTDRNGIVDSLTEFIGISPNMNFPPEGQTRRPLAANIKHALFSCFQKQNEISSEQVLFHRQAEQQRTQDIKDTLPYFLGVSREDDLALKQELDNERRSLRLAEISLKEAEMLKGNELTQATSLIEDAKDCGLLDLETKVDDQNAKVKLLKKILDIKLENLPLEYNDNLDLLQDGILDLEKNITNKEYEIKAAEKFADELSGFSSTMELQTGRLESLELFDDVFHNDHKCPFCFNEMSKSMPNLESMKKTLENLRNDLKKLAKIIQYLEKK